MGYRVSGKLKSEGPDGLDSSDKLESTTPAGRNWPLGLYGSNESGRDCPNSQGKIKIEPRWARGALASLRMLSTLCYPGRLDGSGEPGSNDPPQANSSDEPTICCPSRCDGTGMPKLMCPSGLYSSGEPALCCPSGLDGSGEPKTEYTNTCHEARGMP